MIPTAIVKSKPELTGTRTAMDGLLTVSEYRMTIGRAPDEPIPTYGDNETFNFLLTGNNPDTRDLVPGTPIHIGQISRGQGGELHGFGINLAQYGCCNNCEAEGEVQFSPEARDRKLCARCVAGQIHYETAPTELTQDLG